MREIVCLQFGQCGNQIGTAFWRRISEEHQIDYVGHYSGEDVMEVEKADVYFKESMTGRYIPRCILIDMSPESLDLARQSDIGTMFNPDGFINGVMGAGNNYARAYHGEGKILAQHVMDHMRDETEDCDCLQGFQYCHSVGGGTGSGLTSLISQQASNEYSQDQSFSYTILPSPRMSDVVVEPYNAVLGTTLYIKKYKRYIFKLRDATTLLTRLLYGSTDPQ